jgi:hypothetical protein
MAGDLATVSVTGTGYVNYFNSRIGGLTVNNAAAFVTLQDMSLVGPTTVTAGVFQVNHANYFAATESGNAITAASGTTVTLRNTNFYTPSGVVARVSLAGNYSFNDVVVDRANSTLGTNLGSIARFDALDTFGPVYANGSAGAAGQILTSAGAGAPPTWNNAGGVPNATPTVFGLVKGLTGTANVSLGCNALVSDTSGNGNVALGVSALCSNVSAPFTTAVGACSLCASTGSTNTALGALSGKNITTGFLNVIVGANVDAPSATGSCQLAIGYDASCYWLTGCSDLNIKPGAGIVDCAGSIGTPGQALLSTGSNKIVWGSVAPSCATPLIRGIVFGCTQASNSALGQCALKSVTSGLSNTAVGFNALSSLTTSIGSTAIGDGAAQFATGCQNVAVGAGALYNNGIGIQNTAVGHWSMLFSSGFCNTALGQNSLRTASGTANVSVGINAGSLLSSGNNNLILGPNVQAASATNSCQLAIGFNDGQNWLTGDCTKAIKPGAGIIDCANSTGTAGQVLSSNGANGVCWANSGSSCATPTVRGVVYGCTGGAGLTSAFLGYTAGCSMTIGRRNTLIGCRAGVNMTTQDGNTAIGADALGVGAGGSGNTAIGDCALPTSFGDYNIAIGYIAGGNISSGGRNTFIGYMAGNNVSSCNLNVAIGYCVTAPNTNGSCQLAIGFNSFGCCWLTGDSTKAIKPGAGVIDCANSCGTNGQVLISNGSNAIQWQTGAVGGWTDAGAMAIAGTTSAPTFGTVVTNKIYYRQIGPKEWEVVYKFVQSTGGSTGVGDYLFTLPAGLTFNTTLPFQNAYTGLPGATPGWLQLMIPGPTQGHINKETTSAAVLQPVVYDSTRFRLIGLYQASTSPAGAAVTNTWNSVSSGFYELGGNWNFVSRFAFTAA